MVRARPLVHLFVGLHKTGSSSIRFALDVHRDLLDRHGFHLPRATWTQYVDGFWNGGHNNLAWEICRRRPLVDEWGSVADLVAEIHDRPEPQHIVFTEDLDFAGPEDIERLRHAFSAFDVRVIVFLRNQPDWLRSMSSEERKFFGAPSAEDWYRTHAVGDPRLDYHAFCQRWADAFGHITVKTYEALGGRPLEAFLDACDAPVALRAAFAERSVPVINVSYGELPLTLIRHASDIGRTAGVDARYFNTVISPAILTAATQLYVNDRRSAPIPPDVLEQLGAGMRQSNARLAAAFDLELGPAYLDPTITNGYTVATPPDLAVGFATSLIVASCFDVGIRAASRSGSLSGCVPPQPSEFANRFYPWSAPLDEEASQALDEWLDDAWHRRASLYVEHKGDNATVYRQRDGELIEVRRLDSGAWKDLARTIQARAHLHTASWNNVCEGRLLLSGGNAGPEFWVRRVPTTDGTIVVADLISQNSIQAARSPHTHADHLEAA